MNNKIFTLVIPGEPLGKQRPRLYGSRLVSPKKTVDYETYIKELFVLKYQDESPIDGPVKLETEAYFKIPASASARRVAAMEAGEIIPVKRPDFDNVEKIIADALKGLAFHDDAQIAESCFKKRWSKSPRLAIIIRALENSK